MKLNRLLTVMLFTLLILVSQGQTQSFTVTPDSTYGKGYLDSLYIFNSTLVNEWDQLNIIFWVREMDIPDGWEVEICQLDLACWPYFVDSDTMRLPANGEDKLQVKYYPQETYGIGTVTVRMTALADSSFHEEITVRLEAIPLAVRPDRSETPATGSASAEQWFSPFGGMTGVKLYLPATSFVRMTAFDINGRNLGKVWEGYAQAGSHVIAQSQMSGFGALPVGVYNIKVDTGTYGTVWTKVVLIR